MYTSIQLFIYSYGEGHRFIESLENRVDFNTIGGNIYKYTYICIHTHNYFSL
jgi:hypothetical protein